MDVAGAFSVGAAVGAVLGAIAAAFAVIAAMRRRRSATAPPKPPEAPEQPTTTEQPPATEQPLGKVRLLAATSEPPADTDQSSAAPQAQPAAGEQPVVQTDRLDGLARHSLGMLRTGVVVLDASGEVIFANSSAGQLDLIREVDGRTSVGPSVLRSIAARVRRSGKSRDIELELPRSGGREPLGVRVRVVALDAGHVAIEVEDVTEAHRVARVRRDFVANVSHELKTPVGALQLLSEALIDATDDPEAAHRFAERILHESTRLGRLVAELLELSRLQGGEPLPAPEMVAVDRIVNEVLDRSRTAASAKEITVQIAGRRGLKLYGHERLLVTALANLVDNAIAYSPERTTVTIAPERTGDRLELSVTDEGIGIAPKDQSRIFERFYRADPARSRATGGTGLGLAIVKHIATNHGGRVTVRSALGQGSTFTLRLPVRPQRADSAPQITDTHQGSDDPATAM